ncbi:putative metallopeptidase [Metarhizium acridum CQMa 102]|uniref:Putative metallopeptidase n=1 Tax=Metarhizium acridum (strain CQMa 102) TaxID=655827 RepID=E9EC16_METAQ|nr:putative metallopeptidase [Metarhizium acridum CQMa 102]EFY86552.1 putative metallopeptidase [Metarhizium acridum CQMa 102]
MSFWVVERHNRSPLLDGSYIAPNDADYRDFNTNTGAHDEHHLSIHGRLDNRHWNTNASYENGYQYAVNEQVAQSEQSVPVPKLAFLVIHEGDDRQTSTPPLSPSPKPHAYDDASNAFHTRSAIPVPLERTESGLSISSDASAHHHGNSAEHDQYGYLLEDLEAARLVRQHISSYRRRFPDSQPERILKALINPKSRGAEFRLDNDALRSIFSASNELFFASRLTRRVAWDWSHSTSQQYDNHIVGTTALRRSARLGGWETLIVLSSPILRDNQYNRRLLISTFLHEMIHSFMFVTCGLKAKQYGGHTDGFREIAGIIDDWAGKNCLHLRDMEADLSRWRGDDFSSADHTYGFDYIHDAAHFEQAARNGECQSHKYADYLQPPYPRGRAVQEEWSWNTQEGFGEGSQYVANLQYVPG